MNKAKLTSGIALIGCVLALSLAAGMGVSQEAPVRLMPLPAHLVQSPGRLAIDGTFSLHLTGYQDQRLPKAAARLIQRLQRKTGIPLDLSSVADPASVEATLEIHCGGAGEPIQSPQEDESYTLEVNGQGARLAAPSPVGIFRGMETFLQLIKLDGQSFFVPFVTIEDRPRFCWRGLLIDAARHWEPAEVIRRNLDAMAAMKMNVLHWHLSDDQGFRVESRIFPKLHQAGSEGKYYTQSEVREIISYARDRGIRVVPEFDMPGHTTAWLVGYPELASSPGPYQIERSWGVFDPCMDPTRKTLYAFLDSFFAEMASLFPDAYFHIGGDEVNGKQWNTNSEIKAFKMRMHFNDNRDLQAYFNQRLLKILKKHGKKLIGWDEILHPDLPEGITVQTWRGQANLVEGARRGYAGIFSYGYYLDQMQPASFHYGMDPLSNESANLKDSERARILGGEACMWGEFVNQDTIESRIWPRTAAIAERLWSPAEVRNVQDMYRRLEYADRELDSLGLMHRNNYAVMLQRLAGDQGAAPIKILAELLQPAKFGVRVRARKYSSLTPLNRMVDVVWPESSTARRLGDLIDNALADPAGPVEVFQKIRELLARWRDNRGQVKPIIEQSFLLREIDPLSQIVSELSVTGLQALDYIESHQKPPETWKKEAVSLLQRSDKPQAELLAAIFPPIKKLIEAAITIPD